jgi:hypothetical protein
MNIALIVEVRTFSIANLQNSVPIGRCRNKCPNNKNSGALVLCAGYKNLAA